MRIIELLIGDEDFNNEEVGIDGIALVKRPAHEENWLAFSEEKPLKNIYEVLENDQLDELAKALVEIGEDEKDLLDEGYELYRVEELSQQNHFVGDTSSDPNAPSMEDYAGIRTRYKYVGPKDSKNREFCSVMLTGNKVYRIEDIDRMTQTMANDQFGYYDIFKWRGSYNCRHKWVKLIYKPIDPNAGIAQNRILNNADRRRNLDYTEDIPQEDTTTLATANNKRVRLTSQDFKMVDVIDNNPLFDNREEALEVANIMGCEGVHIHKVGHKDHFMPCSRHPEKMEDLYEVPQYARDKACKARRYKEENPEVDCGERTGWIRSAQLCNEGKVSRDVLGRMASFGRHLPNAEKQDSYEDGCALLMVDAWGGKEGIEWAQRELDRVEMIYDNPCQSGYVAYGTKIKDGKEVPNCVPRSNQSKLKFNYNDEKMEITGAALIPNKLIIRSDFKGQPYWVYFSEESVKRLAFKFMKDKRLDATNIEHTTLKANDTYVVESWISSDEYNDKSNALGLNYPVGSWIITMKTDDPKVWSDIKEGKYLGFSVEGYFEEKQVFNNYDYYLSSIKNIINNVTNE